MRTVVVLPTYCAASDIEPQTTLAPAWAGTSIVEIRIGLTDRRRGSSKMSKALLVETLRAVAMLRIRRQHAR